MSTASTAHTPGTHDPPPLGQFRRDDVVPRSNASSVGPEPETHTASRRCAQPSKTWRISGTSPRPDVFVQRGRASPSAGGRAHARGRSPRCAACRPAFDSRVLGAATGVRERTRGAVVGRDRDVRGGSETAPVELRSGSKRATTPSSTTIVRPRRTRRRPRCRDDPRARAIVEDRGPWSRPRPSSRVSELRRRRPRAAAEDPRPRSSGIAVAAVDASRGGTMRSKRAAASANGARHGGRSRRSAARRPLALPRHAGLGRRCPASTSLHRSSARRSSRTRGPGSPSGSPGLVAIEAHAYKPELGRDGVGLGGDRRDRRGSPLVAHSGSFRPVTA